MMIRYITQMIFCALVFVMSTNYSYGQPGEDIADTPKDIGIDDVFLQASCVKADVNITYENGNENTNANVMDINCPNNTNINIQATFDWTRYCFSSLCDFHFQLYICGVPVKRIDFDQNQANLEITLNVGKDLFLEFVEQSDLKAKNCDVELRLMNTCIGMPGSFPSAVFKAPIQIINSANVATSFYFVDKIVGHMDGPNTTANGIKACCCKPEVSPCEKNNLLVRVEDINESYTQSQSQTTTKNSISINAVLKGTISASRGKFLNGSFEVSGQYNGSITWENSTSDGIKETFKIVAVNEWPLEPYAGSCVSPEFYIIFEKWEKQKWEADCINGDVKIETISTWEQPEIINGQIKLFFGGQTEVSGCGRGRNISTNTTVKIITSVNRNSCTGNLELGTINTDLDQQTTQVWWTNENGDIFKELNLNNVPYGKYTIHLEDQCCNYFTETRILCPEMSTGAWYAKGDQFCKDINCGGGCSYTECVTPDRIEDIFDQNQKKCIKEYYYNNELLGTTSVDATFETEWDDIFEECVTTYYCNGQEVYEDEYEPGDSEWIYDESGEECQLTVNCVGEEIENVQQEEAVIEWEWDDFWEECVSNYITCDGMQVDGEVTVDAYDVGEWLWYDYKCDRDIYCVQGGSFFTQVIDGDAIATNQYCENEDDIYYEFYCDGELVAEGCTPQFHGGNTESRSSKRSPNIHVTSNDNGILLKIKNPDYKNYSVKIIDLLGRVTHEKSIENNAEKINLAINGVKTGIYIIALVENGELVHSQKVFIQN